MIFSISTRQAMHIYICKSSYNAKDIGVTKHVVAMVVTASKTSKSYVINQFHF